MSGRRTMPCRRTRVWCMPEAPRLTSTGTNTLARLVGADGGLGATGGDAFGTRAYTYNGRGDRTGETQDGISYTQGYGGAADQLTSWEVSNGNLLQWNYAYGPNGAVSSVASANDSTGSSASSYTAPGLLSGVVLNDTNDPGGSSHEEQYLYASGDSPAWIVEEDGQILSTHLLDSDGIATSETGTSDYEDFSFADAG